MNSAATVVIQTEPPRCRCQAVLTFKVEHGTVICHCSRCKRIADRDCSGHAVFVYGYGKTNESALEDWRDAMRRF